MSLQRKQMNASSNQLSARLNAFTLVEMLVVISLAMLLLVAGVNGVKNLSQAQGRKGAVSNLISAIRLAQTHAITNDGNVRIVFAHENLTGEFETNPSNFHQGIFAIIARDPQDNTWKPLTAWSRFPGGIIFSSDALLLLPTDTHNNLPKRPNTSTAVHYIEFDEMGGLRSPNAETDITIRERLNSSVSSPPSETLRINPYTGTVVYLTKSTFDVIDRPN